MAHPQRQKLYILSAPADFLLMGGLSLFLLLPFFFLQSSLFNKKITEISILLLWFANWPHFSSTIQRLYSSSDSVRRFPLSTLLVPLVILTAAVGALLQPETWGMGFIKLYALWAPYHFCGQSLGITLLYCRRANVKLTERSRFWLSSFLFSTVLVLLTQGESFLWDQKMYGIQFSSLQIPLWTRIAAKIWCGLSALVFLYWYLRDRHSMGNLPWIAFVPVLSQSVWFLIGPYIAPLDQLVPFFHSIQYLPIILLLHVGTEQGRILPWARTNFVGGAFLFWASPILLMLFGFPLQITRPVIFAAINIHHFWIDGVIWKLRDVRVSSPLLGSLRPA
jgi:hypothetical protein